MIIILILLYYQILYNSFKDWGQKIISYIYLSVKHPLLFTNRIIPHLQLAVWPTRCPGTARAIAIRAASSTPAPGLRRILVVRYRSPNRSTTTATRTRTKTATRAATSSAAAPICPIPEPRPASLAAAAMECKDSERRRKRFEIQGKSN